MAHWLTVKKYLPSQLTGEEAKSAEGQEGVVAAAALPTPAPRTPARAPPASYNPNAALSPAGAAGTPVSGQQRNVLLDKIHSLESTQMTLISQLMAAKEELGSVHAVQREKEDACTAAKAELASRVKALERQTADLNAEIVQLQSDRTRLESEVASFSESSSSNADLADRNAKLLKERLWFEKRYVMSETYKHDMEEALESITKERDHLQTAVTKLEEAVLSNDGIVGGSSEAQRAVVDQLRQAIADAQNNTRQAESHVRSEQTKNATLEKQIAAIKEENTAIQDELERNLRDASDYLQTIQDIKNQLANKDVRIHDLQTSYQSARDSVIALTAGHDKTLAAKDAAYHQLQLEFLEMKERLEGEIAALQSQNQELEQQLSEATVFTGGALVPAKKALGMQAEKAGVSSGAPGRSDDDQEEEDEEKSTAAPKRAGPAQDKAGVSSGAPTAAAAGTGQGAGNSYAGAEEDDEDYNNAPPARKGGPMQDKQGVSSGALGRDESYASSSADASSGPQQRAAPGQDRSAGQSSGAPPGEDDRYASPSNKRAPSMQDRAGQSSGAPGEPAQAQGSQRRAPPQQDRQGQSSGAPGSSHADGGGYSRMDDPEDSNMQHRTPQHAGPNQDRQGQSSGAPGEQQAYNNNSDDGGNNQQSGMRRAPPTQERSAGQSSGAPSNDHYARSQPQQQQQQSGGQNRSSSFDDDYATPGAVRSQKRGPMQDKAGVSAGSGCGEDGREYASSSGGNGGNAASASQSQAQAQELAAALAQRNRDFEHLNSQFQALLVEHQALTAAAERRQQHTGSGGSNGGGAGGSLLSVDKNNALNPAAVSATSFFIPSNLHALSNGELVQLLVSLKSTLLALQDANDTLSSRAFMAAHTITRLEHSAIRTSELQKYILSQESIWLFKQQTLQRDCILLRNERDEIVRKLLSESSDQLLKQLVERVENESKIQADQLASRDAELDSLHKTYRELEVWSRSKEAEHAETVHAIEAQCGARMEQLKNAHAEQVRALELKCERIFVAGGSDAMVLRGETERAYEARLAQQLAFWQEKESAWLAEKTLILREWSKEESLWSAEKDSFEALRSKLSLQRSQLDEENNKIWSLKLAEKEAGWASKLEEMSRRQADSDRIIKGMEIQWKRRVEDWKEKEAVLVAQLNAIQGGNNIGSSSGGSGGINPRFMPGGSDYEQATSRVHYLSEAEKERFASAQQDWSTRERDLSHELAALRLEQSAWRKERESLANQVEILGRDLKEQQRIPYAVARRQMGASQGDLDGGRSAGAPGQSASSGGHFESSAAFRVPIAAASNTSAAFVGQGGSAGASSGTSRVSEQEYEARIAALTAQVDALRNHPASPSAGHRSGASGGSRDFGSPAAGRPGLGRMTSYDLNSPGSAGAGAGGSGLQQRLDEKTREVYALNRKCQRLEEELAVLQRRALNAASATGLQSDADAAYNANRVDSLLASHDEALRQIEMEHQTKIAALHADYGAALDAAKAAATKSQSDFVRNLAAINDSHKTRLESMETELRESKDAAHAHLKSVQMERLEEITRHNSAMGHLQREKAELQRALDAKQSELNAMDLSLRAADDSLRILESQLAQEHDSHEVEVQAIEHALHAARTGAGTDVAWQKEKRALLEMQLQAENKHGDEVEALLTKLSHVEHEIDREREKNKILYTQIQILSERNAKAAKRVVTGTSRALGHGVEQLDDHEPEQLDSLARRLLPLSARVREQPWQYNGPGPAGGDVPRSGGAPPPSSSSAADQARASQALAEAEASHAALAEAWSTEKSLLETHIRHLQADLEASMVEKSDLQAEFNRLKAAYAALEKSNGGAAVKAQLLQQQMGDASQANAQLQSSLSHLQSQYNALSASLASRSTADSKRAQEVERNLQAALLDLKRMEMEKLTLHRCVATLTEKCSKMQQALDACASGGSPVSPDSGSSPSELLKLLSSQMTSLTSTVEKQQLRLRLLQSSVDKWKAECEEGALRQRDMEQSLFAANTQIHAAHDRAKQAEDKWHRMQMHSVEGAAMAVQKPAGAAADTVAQQ